MMKTNKTKLLFLALLPVLIVSYQNCGSKVNFSTGSSASGLGNNTGSTAQALKTIQPTLAVRGINCMACHGVFGSNIVTDFGYGTANFNPLYKSLTGTDENRSAYDNVTDGWQNMKVTGTVYVPHVVIPASEAKTDYGLMVDTTFASLIQLPNILNAGPAMASGVTPLSGSPAVQELSSVAISYPSKAEILNLLPTALQAQPVAVSAINVDGIPNSTEQGFGVSTNGKYVTNTTAVSCFGDVVVKGPLFLNNLQLQTDAGGCRLYVSNAVFIQGPITYVNGGSSNLQISSASAVILGFSTKQLGALQGAAPAGDPSKIRTNIRVPGYIDTVGGLYPRMSQYFDSNYNPSGAPINGVASLDFFDGIVTDSLAIGALLNDAGEPGALNNLVPGETVIHDNDQFQGSYGGNLVSINYTGLLLNAPQIHSRYAGSFKGVLIADVTMLARNPSSVATIEQFIFDPLFNTAPIVLPALSTNILDIEQ